MTTAFHVPFARALRLRRTGLFQGGASRARFSAKRIVVDDEEKEESIEGVWVFHRHGDRTPCRSLCDGSVKKAESELWTSKLPPDGPLNGVRGRFPVKVHSSNAAHFDSGKEPFGALTMIGAMEMVGAGQTLRARYVGHEHAEFLEDWDIEVCSTNYMRTITSAQFFLDGLLCNPDSTDILPVQVREREEDTLNAFDKHPEIMRELVSEVIASPEFQDKDTQAIPLASLLCNLLPNLEKPGKSALGGPSVINWVLASDHFICREAHGIPLTHLNKLHPRVDPRQEVALKAMKHRTLEHRCWRFRQWYKSPPLLSTIAAPPLREVQASMLKTLDGLSDNLSTKQQKRPFLVYSCHDVTILSLLYGLRADIVMDAKIKYWPGYASTLVFELVRQKNGVHFVRVLLNGDKVRSVHPTERKDSDAMGLDDFTSLVTDLEAQGVPSLGGANACGDLDKNTDQTLSTGWTG